MQDDGEQCSLEEATQLARQLLQHYDQDNDRFLAKEEFMMLFKSNHQLLNFLYHAGFVA